MTNPPDSNPDSLVITMLRNQLTEITAIHAAKVATLNLKLAAQDIRIQDLEQGIKDLEWKIEAFKGL